MAADFMAILQRMHASAVAFEHRSPLVSNPVDHTVIAKPLRNADGAGSRTASPPDGSLPDLEENAE